MTFERIKSSKPRRNFREQQEFSVKKRKGEDRKSLMRCRRADVLLVDDCNDFNDSNDYY